MLSNEWFHEYVPLMQHAIKGSWLKWMQNQMDPKFGFWAPFSFHWRFTHILSVSWQRIRRVVARKNCTKKWRKFCFQSLALLNKQPRRRKTEWTQTPGPDLLFFLRTRTMSRVLHWTAAKEKWVLSRESLRKFTKRTKDLCSCQSNWAGSNQASVRRKVSIKLLSKMAHSCRSHWQLTLPIYWKQRVNADQLHCPIFTPSKENPQILNKWDLGKHYYAFALQDRSLHSHYLSSLTYRKDVSSMIKNVKWMFGEEH